MGREPAECHEPRSDVTLVAIATSVQDDLLPEVLECAMSRGKRAETRPASTLGKCGEAGCCGPTYRSP